MRLVVALQKTGGILIFAVALGYLTLQMTQVEWIEAALLASCTAMTVILIAQIRGIALGISLCMLVLANLLFVIYQLDWSIWQKALTFNLNLVALFAFVPLLSLPVRYGGYVPSLERVLRHYCQRKKTFFAFVSGLTFVMGSIMNLGAIRLIFGFLEGVPYRKDWMGRALLIGFISTIMWSPYFASVALVIKLLNLEYGDFALFAIPEALLLLFVGNCFVMARMNRQSEGNVIPAEEPPQGLEQARDTGDKRKVIQLAVLIALMLICVVLLEEWTGANVMVLVACVSLTVSVCWLYGLGMGGRWKEFAEEYFFKLLPGIGSEVVLFLSAGFFGVILLNTPFHAFLLEQLQWIDGLWQIAKIVLFLAIPVLLSVFGIHQIISVTVFATSIDPALIGLHPAAYAILLMAAWSISTIVSPVTPVNITIGNLLQENSIKVGLRRNCGYALTVLLLTTGFVCAVNWLLHS